MYTVILLLCCLLIHFFTLETKGQNRWFFQIASVFQRPISHAYVSTLEISLSMIFFSILPITKRVIFIYSSLCGFALSGHEEVKERSWWLWWEVKYGSLQVNHYYLKVLSLASFLLDLTAAQLFREKFKINEMLYNRQESQILHWAKPERKKWKLNLQILLSILHWKIIILHWTTRPWPKR